ncbi:DUF72 domain-containing protein [Bdellovibrio sp. 22V]|uniref:DUF72 domain-containing protein n=1 Tax=Bdellovibrio TaxID=958 RepID=UPI00254294FD|nr:DUF72 domain-containing protein [Bdellovibrio sp. 22V]WII72598.1 DUF72 domain-containing protein [Bdellovibrio sp. 22V]
METRVGISGWRYKPWRGVFYPEDLAQNKELFYASRQINSIEINGTFYSTQSPESFKKWYAETPKDFVFSVKCPRYITHIRRLNDIEIPMANFFASGVLHLKEKLGAFLWQFPPSFRFEEEKIENFFKLLPRTMKEAAKLAQKSDRREPSFPEGAKSSSQILRHAMEVRSHTFENPDFIDLLREYKVALVFADTAGKWPYIEDVTSDFVYLRLHGDEEIYKSGYDEPTLNWWADRIKLWRGGKQPQDALAMSDKAFPKGKKDVFVYFDNDIKVRAPEDAKSLIRKL